MMHAILTDTIEHSFMTPPALLEQLARTYSLDLVVMFGSRSRGHARGDSDTDIAVRGLRELSREEELTLATELDRLYPNVDLCDLRKASPLLLGAIGQDAQLLYQRREGLFEEFKIFAWNQYMDFKPQLDRMRERTKQEIDELE
jgi:predicted nucleotidyltransferase